MSIMSKYRAQEKAKEIERRIQHRAEKINALVGELATETDSAKRFSLESDIKYLRSSMDMDIKEAKELTKELA